MVEVTGMVFQTKIQKVEETDVLGLLVVTGRVLGKRSGNVISVGITPFSVIVYPEEGMPQFDQFQPGTFVHVIGMAKRACAKVDIYGRDEDIDEIIASRIDILPDGSSMSQSK